MQVFGDVPKWLKGADSKSARRRKACGGSNPSISANKKTTRMGGFLLAKKETEGFERLNATRVSVARDGGAPRSELKS